MGYILIRKIFYEHLITVNAKNITSKNFDAGERSSHKLN